MWFKNLLVYRLPPDWSIDADAFENRLARQPLQPCGGFDMESRGWVYPRSEGRYLHTLNRQWLLALGINQKLLPAAVVNQAAKDRAAEVAERQGHPVGRKQMREIRDRMHQELLPRAFTRLRTTRAWIDPVNGWLAIDAAGEARAEALIKSLLLALDDLPLKRLETGRSPAAAMTDWLAAGAVSRDFTIDQDLELRSSDEGKATVRYVRHGLEGREIRDHIAAGKTATRLGMTWKDRISFVLTEQLQIKRLAFLDILKGETGEQPEDADEQFDVNFALMAGELARMLADLVKALGGEKPQEG